MATSSNKNGGGGCVYVGNIPFHASEQEILKVLEEVGPIVSFRLITDPKTQKPKGYGFCNYKDHETALSACRNLHGYLFRGRELKLNLAGSNKNDTNPVSTTDRKRLHEEDDGAEPGRVVNVDDPLTLHLSKMSIGEVTQFISELETLATKDVEQARTILLSNPNLPNALFDAQRMLGIASPRMLQMPIALQPLVSMDLKANDRPSKMMKLNNTRASAPVRDIGATSVSVGRQVLVPQVTVQVDKIQIPSDVDAALLRQVRDLKPEQLISLPLYQQQQVIELQRMLRQAAGGTGSIKSPLPATCSREENVICFNNQAFTM